MEKPTAVYGVLQQDRFEHASEEIAEQVRRLGYVVLDSGFGPAELEEISAAFERTRREYIERWGEARLKALNELHTVRAPLASGAPGFMKLATNPNLLAVLKLLIGGKFILNQQNQIINPPNQPYSQGAWHRDLPYQHYVSSSPLAVNALFCVDDFTLENGATFVLPASHKAANLPSAEYIRKNAMQVEAKAGQYLLLDGMLFHSGGFNGTARERRAVNHLYTIPYFKQQINLPKNMDPRGLPEETLELLGFNYQEPDSVESYLALRAARTRAA